MTEPAVCSDLGGLTYRDAALDVFALRSRVDRQGVATVRSDDVAVVLATMAALDGWASEVHLLPDNAPTDGGNDVIRTQDFGLRTVGVHLHDPPGVSNPAARDRPPNATPTRWVVYTSGTTGTPKPIAHTLSSLSRTVSISTADERLTWGLLYDPNRMAGLQVLLQAWSNGSTLIAPGHTSRLGERIDLLRSGGVDALSATPTLWRQILQSPAAKGWRLRQITMGGEIADDAVLRAVKVAFPDARVYHVFASTETGAAFTVRDGRAGFPVSYLEAAPKGIRLEVRSGRLYIHAPEVAGAAPDGFVDTGDEVVINADRVEFRGRSTGVVNVGGANVWPEQVESLLRHHPDVADAAVAAKANSLVGHVLIASVVLREGVDRTDAGKRIRLWARQNGPKAQVPASITVVDKLNVSSAGKAIR